MCLQASHFSRTAALRVTLIQFQHKPVTFSVCKCFSWSELGVFDILTLWIIQLDFWQPAVSKPTCVPEPPALVLDLILLTPKSVTLQFVAAAPVRINIFSFLMTATPFCLCAFATFYKMPNHQRTLMFLCWGMWAKTLTTSRNRCHTWTRATSPKICPSLVL